MLAPARIAVCSLAVAVLIAACGGSPHHRTHTRHRVRPADLTVRVYSSLPLAGADGSAGRAIQRGIELALSQANGRAGDFLVRYRSLDDARAGHGTWAAALTARNARTVATDPAAVAYIGDFESSASRISLPILNQA